MKYSIISIEEVWRYGKAALITLAFKPRFAAGPIRLIGQGIWASAIIIQRKTCRRYQQAC